MDRKGKEDGTTRRSTATAASSPSSQQHRADKEGANGSVRLKNDDPNDYENTTLHRLNDRGGGAVSFNVMAGLTVAGMAASLLTTVFGIFHVDLFLNAYSLPLATYSIGNALYSVINTANDVAGAWIVDQLATSRKRSDLVGLTSCLFALCFLVPFVRPWKDASNWLWDGTHFVISLSLYDTMFSFAMILYSSIVMDDHEMTEAKRIRFLAICKVVNLIFSFGVTRLGLYLYDTENLGSFRLFLLALVAVVCILSVISQGLILGSYNLSLRHISPPKVKEYDDDESSPTSKTTRPLEWRRALDDFWKHKNFRAWIGMEMLLESQGTFNVFFRKTFVDRLVAANGIDKDKCDWMMSLMKPVTVIVSLAMFIPIRKVGYPKVYRFVFVVNLTFSSLMFCLADETSTPWIVAFLIFYPVLTSSLQSAGFSLAMADMVMDMKHMHATDGRYDEPSLAGLFMGNNALLCKPMESVLPIIAAQAMSNEANAQRNLFYILILPPLIYSCLQLLSWKNYSLGPQRVAEMRQELKTLLSSSSTSSQYDTERD